jgi:hypothetical protein
MRPHVDDAPLTVPVGTDGAAWLTISDGGSTVYHGQTSPIERIVVRLGLARTAAINPPVVISDLWCTGVLSATTVRRLPLAAIELACNHPRHYRAVTERIAVPTPPSWRPADDLAPGGPPQAGPVVARLDVPPGKPKPNEFYVRVADAFAGLSATSPRPAVELATANAVPVTTVHGWVAEARRRGFLPAGERSRRQDA